MYQGTTPTIQLIVPGKDLTDKRIYLTIEDSRSKTQITWISGDQGLVVEYKEPNTIVLLTLTQENTFELPLGSLNAQIRWIDINGKAWATEPCKLVMQNVLLKEVITYE